VLQMMQQQQQNSQLMTVKNWKRNWSRLWKLPKQEEEENEHSEEWLNDFSQEAEKKEAVALKLAAKEAKEQKQDEIYHSMGDGARDAGGLAEQSSLPARELTEVETVSFAEGD
jgi:uncharacterized membrane protein YcjF (UPF0283 family)